MRSSFSSDIDEFIDREVASGRFADREAVISTAVAIYRDLSERDRDLRRRIQVALAQAVNHQTSELDIEALVAEIEMGFDDHGPTP